MSFSKAKIQRFNDVKECTPSPATYNVSLQEKVKLGLISKPGTYSKLGSPTRSETGSVHSTPCFQTPTLPLKKKKFLSFKSAKTSSQQEELREKIVECSNKDQYIRDLIEQIEEMTGKVNNLERENLRLLEEKNGCEGALSDLRQQHLEDNLKRTKKYEGINTNLQNVNKQLRQVRREYEELKSQNLVELSKLLSNIAKFQKLYDDSVKQSREETEALVKKLEDSEAKVVLLEDELRGKNKEHSKKVETLLAQHETLLKKFEENQIKAARLEGEFSQKLQEKNEEVEALLKKLEDNENELREKNEEHSKKVETLLAQHDTLLKKLEESQIKAARLEEEFSQKLQEKNQELEESEAKIALLERKNSEEHSKETRVLLKKLEESQAKVTLLEENFKDVKLLTDLQICDKIKEVEDGWKQKLEEKQREHEAILKECQAISEYTIIQSEVEKNQVKKLLEEKEQSHQALVKKFELLEEEVGFMKSEKHKYQLSISTFKDTIEVLKKRLFNSDRDVEQLKEELEKCEEKILTYEKKIAELSSQLLETQTANEELEMQYESTSKLMQNQVQTIEKNLLSKVEVLQNEAKQLKKDKQLLNEVLSQHHDQQKLLNEAQKAIEKSHSLIYDLENRQSELEDRVRSYKLKLDEETEEAAEIRKKYIEKSGKYDELAHQFEQLLQELDKAKDRIQELENLIGPYQEQLEAYQNELVVLTNEKNVFENEAKELSLKYAEILGHQNHSQKIKHIEDLKTKYLEKTKKNVDLEAKNLKLNKLIDKLSRQIEDMNKPGKKYKLVEDKENLASPKSLKGTQSPGPLKDKN
ncbi:hyaluronan mediated motility receptor [Tribolium castaneum]|uniref:Hyaluronan-mediated motility receptor C-terminal domain-containing protein n=1 Tax=Tribolium castaneum TaxID=7070 RepID=D2A2B7_TRICA|nr:PREDICTED: hyaluronan mediated motility receptor [Tribolium castaneum]EFA02168.1 hypothetical protein TcasGA2_TC007824 [Tribolium castaneum]|eukprot:XP_008191709.1 PREDICTED: hyaluronan mediated motility receptor [Tribolium castaneum]